MEYYLHLAGNAPIYAGRKAFWKRHGEQMQPSHTALAEYRYLFARGRTLRGRNSKGGIINMKVTNIIALTLVVIGALNWGLIGFFGYDVVTALFHENLFWIARTIFALVGIAGLWCLTFYHSVGQGTGR